MAADVTSKKIAELNEKIKSLQNTLMSPTNHSNTNHFKQQYLTISQQIEQLENDYDLSKSITSQPKVPEESNKLLIEIQEMQSQNKNLLEYIDTLKQEAKLYESNKSIISKKEKENAQLRKELSDTKIKCTSLERQNQSLQEQINSLQEKLLIKDGIVEDIRSLETNLQTQRQWSLEQIKSLQQEIETSKTIIKTKDVQIQNCHDEYKLYISRLCSTLIQYITKVNAKSDDYQIQQMPSSMEVSKNALKSLESLIDILIDSYSVVKFELSKCIIQIGDLKREMAI